MKILSGRINRGAPPERELTNSNLREVALPFLLRDFQHRCAYSMQHCNHAGGETCMEIDHFDPERKKERVQDYGNLILASRHCNNAKRDFRPTPTDIQNDRRLLNPCEEWDYGVHLFETLETGKLHGKTAAGKTQIRVLALNAAHFVDARRERTVLWERLSKFEQRARALGDRRTPEEEALCTKLEQILAQQIPPIEAAAIGNS